MSAKLIDFKEKELTDVKIAGKEIRCKVGHPDGNPIPEFWMKCFSDGTFNVLDNLGRKYKNAMIGWCGNFNETDNTFSYIVGGFVGKTSSVPEGFKTIEIDTVKFVAGTITGTEPEIYQKACELTGREAEKKNIKLKDGYVMEWYDERFNPNSSEKIIDLLMPVE